MFVDFILYKVVFIVDVITRTKIYLSEKVFSSIIVTIANGKATDMLCLNAQCSQTTTTTWPTLYFSYFFDDKVFDVRNGNKDY